MNKEFVIFYGIVTFSEEKTSLYSVENFFWTNSLLFAITSLV